jgi:hypothetical protein
MAVDLDAAYTVLVEECGARDDDQRAYFLTAVKGLKRFEFRFMGALGFGGKLWLSEGRRDLRVSCYREDETPDRLAMIERANQRLASLVA